MAHPPFVEAPTVRVAVTSSIDTTAIDRFRQGVSIRTERQRNDGVLARLYVSTNLNHEIESSVLGEGGIFVSDGNIFDDRDRYDPTLYIQVSSSSSFQSVGDGPVGIDGVIEPLTIRDIVTFKSNETFFVRNSIKGNLQEGNEDRYLNSEQIIQFIDLRVPRVQVSFLDSNGQMGDLLTGSVRTVGGFYDADALIYAFDDGASGSLHSGAPGSDGLIADGSPRRSRMTNNDDINAALRAMTGSYDQDFRPIQHKSAKAGFVYRNNVPGTDSISFGGFLRNEQ